jgi:hypothetical protein
VTPQTACGHHAQGPHHHADPAFGSCHGSGRSQS